jgi:choline dehydrogenase-like flavoprotein
MKSELGGRTIGLPSGRVLGGSSALNAQAFIAPSEVGLNAWRDLGNPGWDWASMEPYYKKSHTVAIPTDKVREELGLKYLAPSNNPGSGGPIQTSYPEKGDPIRKAWVDTFDALGYGMSENSFSGSSIGGFVNNSTVNGATKERSYAANAYFEPAKNRPNLHLMTEARVSNIIVDTEAGEVVAKGVQVKIQGVERVFHAEKEVVVAAGALNSPKILEFSGIGDSKRLRLLGIEVYVDNPNVGENLQDHPSSGMSFEVADHIQTLDALNRQEPEAVSVAMSAYQTNKSGPFSGAAISSFAFMPVPDFQTTEGKAELDHLLSSNKPEKPSTSFEFERSVLGSSGHSSACYFVYAAHGNFGSDSSLAKNVTVSNETGKFLTIACELSYPLSRGSVHIGSGIMANSPVINPKYFTNPIDLDVHARFIRYIHTIAATEPMASILKPGGKVRPSFAAFGSDLEAAKDYIRKTMISGWHSCGTCAMLPLEDGGVVNEKLIVYGTKNVRVIDASMIPLIPRGNIQSTVYAVAEKAADLIKLDHSIT